jgi:hypothetical protein
MSDNEPVAWAVHYGLDPDPEVYWHYPRHAAESGRMVVPLYRSPTLTDAEREAIGEACDEGRWYPKDYSHIATLRTLLERTGGGR